MGVINLGILIKKIMGKIAGAGYVKDTDYASSSKGGTIKVDSTYATDITSGGKLKAKEITAEAYSEANDAAFISKKTLDNVLAAQPAGGITVDLLFSGNIVKGGTSYTLDHPYTDYKFLMACNGTTTYNGSSSEVIPTAVISSAANNENFFRSVDVTMTLRFDSTDATKFSHPSGSGTLSGVKIYGIK